MTTFTICDGCAKTIEPGKRHISVSFPNEAGYGSGYHHFHDMACLRRFLRLTAEESQSDTEPDRSGEDAG